MPSFRKGQFIGCRAKRRLSALINESGINKQQALVEATLGTTFREQAEWFLNHVRTRTRKPVAGSTIATWESCLNKRLNPCIGDVLLAQLNNAVAKQLVAGMVSKRLSNSSVTHYFALVKMTVSSAVNEEGDELFPRKVEPRVHPTSNRGPERTA